MCKREGFHRSTVYRTGHSTKQESLQMIELSRTGIPSILSRILKLVKFRKTSHFRSKFNKGFYAFGLKKWFPS